MCFCLILFEYARFIVFCFFISKKNPTLSPSFSSEPHSGKFRHPILSFSLPKHNKEKEMK
jgi:hypothetical protein